MAHAFAIGAGGCWRRCCGPESDWRIWMWRLRSNNSLVGRSRGRGLDEVVAVASGDRAAGAGFVGDGGCAGVEAAEVGITRQNFSGNLEQTAAAGTCSAAVHLWWTVIADFWRVGMCAASEDGERGLSHISRIFKEGRLRMGVRSEIWLPARMRVCRSA